MTSYSPGQKAVIKTLVSRSRERLFNTLVGVSDFVHGGAVPTVQCCVSWVCVQPTVYRVMLMHRFRSKSTESFHSVHLDEQLYLFPCMQAMISASKEVEFVTVKRIITREYPKKGSLEERSIKKCKMQGLLMIFTFTFAVATLLTADLVRKSVDEGRVTKRVPSWIKCPVPLLLRLFLCFRETTRR